MKKTTFPTKITLQNRKWYLIDAQDQILGKVAARAAAILRGKENPLFTPHLDCGDHVIIINCAKIRVSGNKFHDKIYRKHTGYLGHLREITFEKLMEKSPTSALEKAITGMIPRNRLREHTLNKLKLYAHEKHEHEAQQPQTITL